jgi:hypothetical protein
LPGHRETATMEASDHLFLCAAFLFFGLLPLHFAVRKWRFQRNKSTPVQEIREEL